VSPASVFFSTAELNGPDGIISLDANGASIVNRWHTPQRHVTVVITHRFHLAPGVTPGVYAWPLRYEVVPL
jgi:hypothetical protein